MLQCYPVRADRSALRVTVAFDMSQPENSRFYVKDIKNRFEIFDKLLITKRTQKPAPDRSVSMGRDYTTILSNDNAMKIDDLIVWDKVLTEEDVRKLTVVSFK